MQNHKAYVVYFKETGWCDFTHASNHQEARKLFWDTWAYEGDYIDVRARRIPGLDDKPLIGANIAQEYGYDEWLECNADTCRCDVCRARSQPVRCP